MIRYQLCIAGDDERVAVYFRTRAIAFTWARAIAKVLCREVTVWRRTEDEERRPLAPAVVARRFAPHSQS